MLQKQDRKAVSQVIERAVNDINVQASRQPRFQGTQSFLRAWMRFVEKIEDKPPVYQADSRELDAYLLRLMRSEPLLSSVIFQVVTRDKNRGWTLTGAKSTTERYARILHSLHNGKGWRYFTSLAATAYRASNLGYVAEIGYSSDGWPATLWMTDPTRLTLTNNPHAPLQYHLNTRGVGTQFWRPDYFIGGNSMPALEEQFNGLGYCAVMRVITITRLMVGVNYYQLEKLGLRPPKGYLLFRGISAPKKKQAEMDREEEQDDSGTEYYDDVQAIYAQNDNAGIDFISLAQLPDNFDFDKLAQTVIKAYAAALGEPANTLYTIDGGAFGKGLETETQVEATTYIGQFDFITDYQEQLQRVLPRSVHLEFDERDDRGDLIRAQYAQAWAEVVNTLVTPAGFEGEGLLNRQEGRELLAERGIIPPEWTEADEDIVLSDVERQRRKIRHMDYVRHAAQWMPSEPIIRVHFPTGKQQLIFARADEALRPAYYQGVDISKPVPKLLPQAERPHLERILAERDAMQRAILYEPKEDEDPAAQISDEDVDEAIDEYGKISTELDGMLKANAVDTEEEAKAQSEGSEA